MTQKYNNLHFLQHKTALETFIEDLELPLYAKKLMLESMLYSIDKDFNKAVQKENEDFLIQKKEERQKRENQYREKPKEVKTD